MAEAARLAARGGRNKVSIHSSESFVHLTKKQRRRSLHCKSPRRNPERDIGVRFTHYITHISTHYITHRYAQDVNSEGMTEGEFDETESEEPLTNNNKAQCIARRVRGIMLNDNIKRSLDCMRNGFRLAGKGKPLLDLTTHLAVSICMGVVSIVIVCVLHIPLTRTSLPPSPPRHPILSLPPKLFSPDELLTKVCGLEILDASTIEKHLDYGQMVGENLKRNLSKYLNSADEFTLRKLLCFASGTENFPGYVGETPDDINLVSIEQTVSGRLPCGQTCFRTLKLPDEENYDTFEKSLNMAIEEKSFSLE